MGRCLGILLRDRCDLTICSRDAEKAQAVAGRLRLKASGIGECVQGSDVIVAAVPSESLPDLAREISAKLRPSSLFVDVSSVKCGIVEQVSGALPPSVEYVSIHPLFASARVRPKNVILVGVRTGRLGSLFKLLLSSSGARVTEASAEDHDRAMAAVQVLHHFAYLSMRDAFSDMGCSVAGGGISAFETHTLRKTLGVMRLIESNLQTVSYIQRKNKYAPSARRLLIEAAERLDRSYSRPDGPD